MLMEISHTEIAPATAVVTLTGKLMMGPESGQIVNLVDDLMNRGKRIIIFDIAGVTAIDSTGIGRFIYTYNKLAGVGGDMRLVGATGHVFHTFKVSLLDKVFRFFPGVDEALAAEQLNLMPCDAVDWMPYQGTPLRKIPNSGAYFYVTSHMAIDADGAPNAYHPQDRGIDALKNAGFPDKHWKSVLVTDPADSHKPFVQAAGPFAGFFLSMTTLQDPTRPETDPSRYVDATQVPYLVFPGDFHSITGTGTLGDFAIVRNLGNNKVSVATVADIGPADAPLGEVSIQLAENLGGTNVNPRNGSGMPRGPFLYVMFPRSAARPKWPVSPQGIEAHVQAAFGAVGGWDRVLPCIGAHQQIFANSLAPARETD